MTCAVSGLPIEAGDETVLLLLQGNRYSRRHVGECYINGLYDLRSLPIYGSYNDYGKIEDFDSKSIAVKAAERSFDYDIIQKGVGNNSVHDHDTMAGMSLGQLLDAAWSGRLEVNTAERPAVWELLESATREAIHAERVRRDAALKEIDPRADTRPTIDTVTALLAQHGFKTVTTDRRKEQPDEVYVDSAVMGHVRVRIAGYLTDTATLERMVQVLQGTYAAVVTAGSGNYACDGEIQVFPKINAKSNAKWAGFENQGVNDIVGVGYALIRRDVWNSFVRPVKNERGTYDRETGKTTKLPTVIHTVDSIKAELRELWDTYQNRDRSSPTFTMTRELAYRRKDDGTSSFLYYVAGGGDTSGGMPQVAAQFTMASALHQATPFKPKQIDAFFTAVAELLLVNHALNYVRYWWRPSHVTQQSTFMRSHLRFHQNMVKIAKENIAQYRKDNGEPMRDDETL